MDLPQTLPFIRSKQLPRKTMGVPMGTRRSASSWLRPTSTRS